MRTNGRARRRTPAALLLTTVLSAALAACGTSGASGPDGAETSPQVIAEATKALKHAYTGGYTAPPAKTAKPVPGKNIWVVSAWQQVHALGRQAEYVSEAARTLGWTAQTCDGRNNENGGWTRCVRQATAAKADAIVLLAVDCAPVRQALVEARRAGVKIASFSGFDCDDPTQGGSGALFDVPARPVADAPSIAGFYKKLGRMHADTVIAKTSGKAKIIHVSFQDVAMGTYMAKGFTERIGDCAGCEIVGSVRISPADVPSIRQKFETTLLKHPDADTVTVDVDHFFVAGVQQAIVASGRPGLLVVGGECQAENLTYIRSGKGQQICFGVSAGYRAYATADALNRAFRGERPLAAGVGIQYVDAERNLPAAGAEYTGPIDYAGLYKRAWGR